MYFTYCLNLVMISYHKFYRYRDDRERNNHRRIHDKRRKRGRDEEVDDSKFEYGKPGQGNKIVCTNICNIYIYISVPCDGVRIFYIEASI